MSGGGHSSHDDHPALGTLVALGVYAARDLRDRDGVARPLLRRAATRMLASRREPVQRLGAVYLRSDPPTVEEMPAVEEIRAAKALPAPSESEP